MEQRAESDGIGCRSGGNGAREAMVAPIARMCTSSAAIASSRSESTVCRKSMACRSRASLIRLAPLSFGFASPKSSLRISSSGR